MLYTEVYGKQCMFNFDVVNDVRLDSEVELFYGNTMSFMAQESLLNNKAISFKFTIQNSPFEVCTFANSVIVSHIRNGSFETRVFTSGNTYRKVSQFKEYMYNLFNGFKLYDVNVQGFCISVQYSTNELGYVNNFSCHI